MLLSVNKLIIISMLIRLLLIPYFADAFNYWSSSSFANFAINGYNPWIVGHNDPRYRELSLFGYPPPFLLIVILGSLSYMTTTNMAIFLYTLKLPLVFADVLTLYLLCRITKYMTNDENHVKSVALLYAFNPMPLIISTIWGVSDVLAIVCTVAAMYYFLKSNYLFSGFLLGIGCSFKVYPVYLILAFVVKLRKRREIMGFILSVSLPLLIFILPFLAWDANAYLSGSYAFRTKYLFSIVSILSEALGGRFSNITTPLSYIASIPVSILTNLMLAFVLWKKKTPLLTNILIMLLGVYVISPYMWGNYFSWIVPFAVLANIGGVLKTMRKSVLALQLYWVPSFIYMLLVNGWYDNVGGSAGIFYWMYHWLHWKIVPWRYLGANINLFYIFVVIVNFVVGLFFLKILLSSSQKTKTGNIRGNAESEHRSFITSITKHISAGKKFTILTTLLTTLLLLQGLYIPTLSSKWEHIPSPAISPNIIFNDFDNSILNFQWKFLSTNGTYDIHLNDKQSFIELRASSGPLVACLFREVAPSQGTVELRFKFEQLSNDSEKMVITRVEGGYLGVATNYDLGTVFYYQDEYASTKETDKVYALSDLDNFWHVFGIEYDHDHRYIYFDNKLKYNITSPSPVTFSYISLGNSNSTEGVKGVLSFDWVEINMTDFPTGKRDIPRVFTAILIPWGSIWLVLAIMALKKLNVNFWIRKFIGVLKS